jgi:hypothetical protein
MINPNTTILHSDISFPEQSEVISKADGEEMDDDETESSQAGSESELEKVISGDISDDSNEEEPEVIDKPNLVFADSETSREQEYEQGK